MCFSFDQCGCLFFPTDRTELIIKGSEVKRKFGTQMKFLLTSAQNVFDFSLSHFTTDELRRKNTILSRVCRAGLFLLS